MEWVEYIAGTDRTAAYTEAQSKAIDSSLTYVTLGLCGETGEVADKVKKNYRDNNGVWDEKSRHALQLELGDCMWYLARIHVEMGFNPDDTMQMNLDKLASRRVRGAIHGSGDNR